MTAESAIVETVRESDTFMGAQSRALASALGFLLVGGLSESMPQLTHLVKQWVPFQPTV